MIEWDDFVIRRSINFAEFCEQFNIKTKEDLTIVCNKFSVKPPSDLKLFSLFPVIEEKKQIEVVESEVEAKITKEVVTKKNKKNQGVEKK